MRCFYYVLLSSLLAASPLAAQVQPSTPAAAPPLSEDSVRVMSGLVQASVRELRSIYFEPNDARAVHLIEGALHDIPTFNQRLQHYTASLSREQQQLLATRLRQLPWQRELLDLQRSPQFRGFEARAARNPALQQAAARLRTAGFLSAGTSAAPAATPAAATPVAVATPVPKPQPAPAATAAAPAKPAAPKPAAPVPARHTVQKGETLFSIARRYQVTLAQLQAWNSKAAATGVKIGEVLVVSQLK